MKKPIVRSQSSALPNAAEPGILVAPPDRISRSGSEPMSRLVAAVQELSLARDLEGIASVVKQFAREFANADGATFVLRKGESCYYMDEDAIAPLWKGRRFPMTACISGWVMLHRSLALVPDVYGDDRIPVDVYRPTFVKSLAMIPIRSQNPLGAIGTYWAKPHSPSVEEVTILSALADATAVAIQNVQLQAGLAEVQERAEQLELTNRELDAFSASVAHDLRSPLRAVTSFTTLLLEEKASALDAEGLDWLRRIAGASRRMGSIIDDLLRLSFVSKTPLNRTRVSLSELARDVVEDLVGPATGQRFSIAKDLMVTADPGLLRILLENLLSNAFKYSAKSPVPHIKVGRTAADHEQLAFFIQDNGIGIDMRQQDRLFKPFQRLHDDPHFQGLGLGLATAKRVIDRHQGHLWIESSPGQGTTVWFRLPD